MTCLVLRFFSGLKCQPGEDQYSVSGSSNMAASTSRRPQDVPLPRNLDPPTKPGKIPTSRKGKGKENVHNSLAYQSTSTSWEDLASDSAWEWVSLTDPAASKAPPVFTKDGRYDQLLAPCLPNSAVSPIATFSPLSAHPSKFIRLLLGVLFRHSPRPRVMERRPPCLHVQFLTRTTRSN